MMHKSSVSDHEQTPESHHALDTSLDSSAGSNSRLSGSWKPQPRPDSDVFETPPSSPHSQGRLRLRKSSPTLSPLLRLDVAESPIHPVDPVMDADLAAMEAEELELKLQLLRLRKQQLLAGRSNTPKRGPPHSLAPSQAVASDHSLADSVSIPDQTQPVSGLRYSYSPPPSTSVSHEDHLADHMIGMPQDESAWPRDKNTAGADSVVDAKQRAAHMSPRAATASHWDESTGPPSIVSRQPADIHISRTAAGPIEPTPQMKNGGAGRLSQNNELDKRKFNARIIRRMGHIHSAQDKERSTDPKDQLRSESVASQSPHDDDDDDDDLPPTRSSGKQPHEHNQSPPNLSRGESSKGDLGVGIQHVSSSSNAHATLEGLEKSFRNSFKAVAESGPKDEDSMLLTPSMERGQSGTEPQGLSQDEMGEVPGSLGHPRQLSLLNEELAGEMADEELALEIAQEEATAVLQNGQLEDLHPMMKAQLEEAMKRHMPAEGPSGSSAESRHGSTTNDSSISNDLHGSATGRDTNHTKSTPGNLAHEHLGDVGNIPQTALSLDSVVSPERGRQVLSGRLAKHFKSRKNRDSSSFQIAELGTPAPTREEDTCECGKASVSSNQCYFCWPCDGTIFCRECWDKCPPHKKRRFAAARTPGLPHEKSDPATARKIFETLQSDHSMEKQALLHVQDEDTSWFGAGIDEVTSEVVFQDFGRYSRLMAETSARYRRIRYPALVSFVGQTGAGKSSIIRLLIEAFAPEDVRPEVPVVGSSLHADIPTSGDVHLYADVATVDGDQPILYADCEGLDGGERQPMGARSRNKDTKASSSNDRTQSFTKHIRRQHHTSEREILWANTPQKRSREYHVRHLYPRLLYTFSDVIVFVMKNPRVIENTIEQLLRWAAAALETSSNQPVLPHAIIVLNAYDNASDASMWEVNNSTVELMSNVGRAVHQNHSMRKFAEFWRERGRAIETVEMLLLSYYSSVRVVRVPERGRPTLINEQVRKLYGEIQEACNRSRQSKHQVRMLLNSDELQPYLQYAFEHFSRNLDQPFDFVQASLVNNPIPSNFGGNILKLAIDIMELWKDKLDGPSIFKELIFMVASCIMLDSARHRTLGPAEKVIAAYVHFCDDALEEFCNRHWPCEYVHPNTAGRCVNVKAGHQSKGHQLKSGKVLAVGPFESDFTPEKYQEFFRYCIVWALRNLLNRLQEATKESLHLELQKAGEIHRDEVLDHFFKHLQAPDGPKSFVSHTACYSCLIAAPEHALPCGHVLCTPCVQAFGVARGRCIVELTYCPLHKNDLDGQFNSRWPVFIKPVGAGIRILSLDGGGIRGIVELTIMQQIEEALGPGLPIQAFFDLIIGTSTGGIIGLGLGAHGWTTRRCIHDFERLCIKAFTKRKGIGWPAIEHIISFSNHSRYETAPLEGALKEAFGPDQSLFAGLRDSLGDQAALQRLTKVGVVTVTTAGTVALLANYNRVDKEEGAMYQFHRSEKPSAELKTWEAARATSAAPTIFKPFAHDASGQVYQDGALYYNCPVELAMREQRLIWPDVADNCPDIILSLGTGVNKNAKKPLPTRRARRFGMFNHLKNLTKIAIDKIQATLNSEQTWRTFVQQSNPPDHLRDRYIRLNLELEQDPPRMDAISELQSLRDATRTHFSHARDSIKTVADRLLATSFYFALDQGPYLPEVEGDPAIVNGTILCRFAPGSSEIRSLGEALTRRSRRAYNQDYIRHNPYFVVQQRGKERDAKQIVLTTEAIELMMNDGRFATLPVHISQFDTSAETDIMFYFADRPDQVVMYPISGFPRCFMDEVKKVNRPKLVTSPRAKTSQVFNLNWAAFEAKKSLWKFAAAEFLKSADPFQYYSSSDYKNPGNAASDHLLKFSQRFATAGRFDHSTTTRTPVVQESSVYSVERATSRSTLHEMSTEMELREDWTARPPESEDEVVRRQLLRLLLSRSSYVAGPPRLALETDPKLLNIAIAGPSPAKDQPARSIQVERVELPVPFLSPSNSGSSGGHENENDGPSTTSRTGSGSAGDTSRRDPRPYAKQSWELSP